MFKQLNYYLYNSVQNCIYNNFLITVLL